MLKAGTIFGPAFFKIRDKKYEIKGSFLIAYFLFLRGEPWANIFSNAADTSWSYF